MTSEPQAPGAPAIILYRQLDRDDNGRTSHEYNFVRIKILTEDGRKYADVEIPFFKQNEDIHGFRARSVRPDGSSAGFDGKIFEKTIVKAKGMKYLAKTFTLPDVQVGSVIEYSYTRNFAERYVFDSHWVLSDELFTRKAVFSLRPYTSDYSNMHVRYVWQGLPPGTDQPKEGHDHIVRLVAANITAFQAEDYMPPENELKARVDFIYEDDIPESDLEKFWKKVGKRLNDHLEGFIGKKKAMEQAVSQIVSAQDSPEVKLQKIYTRVQQIRNTSYEVQKTAQEERRSNQKDAENVEDIWKRGYGNGWQITWLYLALVRAAGVEAYGVWVSDRSNYFFNPAAMDSMKLDANVVLVRLDGKDLYFDPGAAFTPFGMLPWMETGVSGRRLDKDGGSWIITALPKSSQSRIERKADLKLSDTGDLEGKLTLTFSGLEASRRRVDQRNEDEASRKKFLEDEVQQYVPAACEVELVNKPDWAASQELVAEFNLKVPGWVSGSGRRALFPVGLFSATEKHVFDHTSRVHAIYFEFPSEKSDDVTIQTPLGWQVASAPPGKNQDGHIVTYYLKVESSGSTLHVTRKLNIDILVLENKYYMALRDFFHGVRVGDEQQVILQPIGVPAGN